jgi:hypothetical protein
MQTHRGLSELCRNLAPANTKPQVARYYVSMRDSIPLTPQETDTAHQRWAHARISEAELSQYLNYIYSSVAELCDKAGCSCLAQRFASRPLAEGDACNCTATIQEPGQRAPLVHLLAKLAPLTSLLAAHGHHDLALFTAELARALEPTMDLNLARALAYVALGETDAAARIYSGIVHKIGFIPAHDMQQLAELAAAHSSEDDISALYRALKLQMQTA